jgi:hypothetical protein
MAVYSLNSIIEYLCKLLKEIFLYLFKNLLKMSLQHYDYPSIDHSSDSNLFDYPPSDDSFWTVVPPPIHTHWGSVIREMRQITEYCYYEKVLEILGKDYVDVLKDTLKNAILIEVSGNGYCGFNSFIALMSMIIQDCSRYSYEGLLEIISNSELNEPAINLGSRPRDFDIESVIQVMDLLLPSMGFPQYTAICLCIDEGTYKFKCSDSPNPENTFVLVHSGNHFNALYLDAEKRSQIYGIFSVRSAL